MATVVLQPETAAGPLFAHQLFGSTKDVALPGGAVLTLESMIERKALDSPTLMTFGLTIPTGVATGVVANWLYDKFKGRARVVRIDRTEVTLDKGGFRKYSPRGSN